MVGLLCWVGPLFGREVPNHREVIGPPLTGGQRCIKHVKLASSNFDDPLVLDLYGSPARRVTAIGCHILGKDLLITEPVLVRLLQCPSMLRLGQISYFGIRSWRRDCPSFSRLENALATLYLIHRNDGSWNRPRWRLSLVAALLRPYGQPSLVNLCDWNGQGEEQKLRRLDCLARSADIGRILARHRIAIQELSAMEDTLFAMEDGDGATTKTSNPEIVASLLLMADHYERRLHDTPQSTERAGCPNFRLADLIFHFRSNLEQRSCFFEGEESARVVGNLSLFFLRSFFSDALTVARQSYLREILRRLASQCGAAAIQASDDEILSQIRHSSDETVQLFWREGPRSPDDIEVVPYGEGDMNFHYPVTHVLDPLFRDENGFCLLSQRDEDFAEARRQYAESCGRGFSIVLRHRATPVAPAEAGSADR